MKRIVFLLAFFMMMASCTPSLTEQVESRFPSGQARMVKMLDKSGNCVEEIEYYESGQVKMQGRLAGGLREGEWKAYFLDGRTQSIDNFKQGKLDGVTQVYWDNGNLRWEGRYKNEQRCGKWRFYNEQGHLLKETDYGE